jgi:two-component system sensor histidine kinase HydH
VSPPLPAAWEFLDVDWRELQGINGFLSSVTDKCLAWLEVDGISIFLRVKDSDTFVLAAQAGFNELLPKEASFVLGDPIAGKVAQSGKAALFEGQINPAKERGVGSAIVAPMMGPGEACLGVVNISRRPGRPTLRESDVEEVDRIVGAISVAVGYATALTELDAVTQREAALAKRTSALIASVATGILTLDRFGRIIQANPSASKICGASIVGAAWSDVSPRLPRELSSAITNAIASCMENANETFSANVDGQSYSTSASSHDREITVVIEDITAQVNIERELGRMKRLAEIGRMTAAIAHEIRNPLTGIRGAAQVLQSEKKLSEAKRWGTVIQQEVDSLNRLCDEFLDFAKPLTMRKAPVDVNSLVARILGLLAPSLPKQGVHLTFTSGGEMPIIHGDEERIALAVHNLVRNALDAMPGGGQLFVETIDAEGEVWVEVGDTGAGVPEADAVNLFTPFFTTKASGTGLGLCNSMRIAEAHGGRIELVSSNVGARFRLALAKSEKLAA